MLRGWCLTLNPYVNPKHPSARAQFQGDTPSVLGTGLDELFRHVASLRPAGLAVVLRIFRTLCHLGARPGPDAGSSGSAAPQQVRRSNFPPSPARVTCAASAVTVLLAVML